MEIFPKLYKKTSTGAIQEWTVYVDNDSYNPVIVTKYGQLGGKIQTSTEIITEGKNIGRSNETSPMEQAYFQAKSDWEKQLKKGYVDNVDDAEDGKTDEIIKGGIAPMLAHKFSEQGHKIKYPALVQPKLDGCVSGDTVITTNIGGLPMSEIVNNNIDCLVISYNVKTKQTENKKILNKMKSNENIGKIWYEIETDDGRKLKVTSDHLIYLPKLKCWRRVDELKIDDKILNIF